MKKAAGEDKNVVAPDVFELLHRAEQLAKTVFAEEAVNLKLTMRQTSIITHLAEQGVMTQTQITDATAIDRSTITELIARMVASGLIRRQRSLRDARSYEIRLTRAGRAKAPRAAAAYQRATQRFVGLQTRGDVAVLMRCLRRFAAAGKNAVD